MATFAVYFVGLLTGFILADAVVELLYEYLKLDDTDVNDTQSE